MTDSPSPEVTDPLAPLLFRVAGQDRAAFRALYSACAPKLMGVLIRMLGSKSEAEDALQEVFTRVWLKAGRFDPSRGTGQGWIVALARNHAIDRIRARAPQAEEDALDHLPDPTPRAEAAVLARSEARAIGACFDTLEAERAAAIKGAYLDGLSYQDLAARHDVPLNTMRTWLRRGLMRLRECMDR